jgi:phosphoglycerol transferase MdoB-like AlkP superfamily enzyme
MTKWIRRLPTWLWFSAAGFFVLTALIFAARVAVYDELVARAGLHFATQPVGERLVELRDNEIQRLVIAAIAALLFVGAAVWRMRLSRDVVTHSSGELSARTWRAR